MYLILAVYDAMQSLDCPATRAELEHASGLDTASVRKGLDGLRRRRVLIMDGKPCALSRYALQPGTERPTDLRGRHSRE